MTAIQLRSIPELQSLLNIRSNIEKFGSFDELTTIPSSLGNLPIHGIEIGNTNKQTPVLCLIGGVHGIERIGAQVVISLLRSLSERLVWDKGMQTLMEKIRLLAIPILNPTGLHLNSRSNANGVDLMRNAPIEAQQKSSFLLGGHHISKKLPWFRGYGDLELENKTLAHFLTERAFHSPFILSLDIHSGFGLRDRIWFPYASSTKPFKFYQCIWRLRELLKQSHPHHFYKIEPQSKNYITHGDLWDYLFFEHQKVSNKVFLPLTLEMGSWLWVKKNPLQAFNPFGLFNPMKEHRQKRILRRHWTLLDFLISSCISWRQWAEKKELEPDIKTKVLRKWYAF